MFPEPLKNSNAVEPAIWNSANVKLVHYNSMVDQSSKSLPAHTEQITSEQFVMQVHWHWRDGST